MRLLLGVILTAGTAACNNSTRIQFTADEIAIQPASAVTFLGPGDAPTGFEMPITITNRSMMPIYREGCGYVVERSKAGGGWEPAWTPACAKKRDPLSALLTVTAGRSVTIDIDTRGSGLGPTTLHDGQYRVRFVLLVNRVGGFAPIPSDLSVSSPFKLVRPAQTTG